MGHSSPYVQGCNVYVHSLRQVLSVLVVYYLVPWCRVRLVCPAVVVHVSSFEVVSPSVGDIFYVTVAHSWFVVWGCSIGALQPVCGLLLMPECGGKSWGDLPVTVVALYSVILLSSHCTWYCGYSCCAV